MDGGGGVKPTFPPPLYTQIFYVFDKLVLQCKFNKKKIYIFHKKIFETRIWKAVLYVQEVVTHLI